MIRISTPVPGGLFVQKPSVAHPEETVEKPKEDGGIRSPKSSDGIYGVTAQNVRILYLVIGFFTGISLAVNPRGPVRRGLETEEPVGPGRGGSQPDEGEDSSHYEVDLRVALLFIRVEVGIEDVEHEAEISGIQNNIMSFPIGKEPGHGVEPDDHSDEDKELSVGGEVARKGELLLGLRLVTTQRLGVLSGHPMIQSDERNVVTDFQDNI